MRDPIIIVGAGATAVHFAATALQMGRRVKMLDVGHPRSESPMPEASLNQLKRDLTDPVGHFLGDEFESLILPSDGSEYYGFPPSKSYVFKKLSGYDVQATGFEPLMSFAQGGLAQAWTGGTYPFNDGELDAFPFGWDEMAPAYGEVARRIGVSGVDDDDLSPYYPAHDGLMPPVELDEHSKQLLSEYSSKSTRLTSKYGLVLGRSRAATLSRGMADREACSRCGRCLWGCPSQAFYTPSITLDNCLRDENFEYIAGVRVDNFVCNDAHRVTHVAGERIASGETFNLEVGSLVLAAGTVASGRIFLESLLRTGIHHQLGGLMDNRQVLMPFVNLKRVGKRFDDLSYQYNQIAVGAPGDRPFDYVHGLLTTLTTGLVHPIIQNLPLGLRAGTSVFRNIHAALGLLNINFPDTRREENHLALELGPDGRSRRLLLSYAPEAGEPERIKKMISRFRRFLFALHCIAPPNMTRLRPMGASVHYAGTVPMLADGGEFTADRAGRCRPFENLIFADGSTFPALPAKNLTFTLMANATRIAREALSD